VQEPSGDTVPAGERQRELTSRAVPSPALAGRAPLAGGDPPASWTGQPSRGVGYVMPSFKSRLGSRTRLPDSQNPELVASSPLSGEPRNFRALDSVVGKHSTKELVQDR